MAWMVWRFSGRSHAFHTQELFRAHMLLACMQQGFKVQVTILTLLQPPDPGPAPPSSAGPAPPLLIKVNALCMLQTL